MIVRKHGYVLDVDIEGTSKYSQEHNICDCDEIRLRREISMDLISSAKQISSKQCEDFIDIVVYL